MASLLKMEAILKNNSDSIYQSEAKLLEGKIQYKQIGDTIAEEFIALRAKMEINKRNSLQNDDIKGSGNDSSNASYSQHENTILEEINKKVSLMDNSIQLLFYHELKLQNGLEMIVPSLKSEIDSLPSKVYESMKEKENFSLFNQEGNASSNMDKKLEIISLKISQIEENINKQQSEDSMKRLFNRMEILLNQIFDKSILKTNKESQSMQDKLNKMNGLIENQSVKWSEIEKQLDNSASMSKELESSKNEFSKLLFEYRSNLNYLIVKESKYLTKLEYRATTKALI
jgi:hypothetical protein